MILLAALQKVFQVLSDRHPILRSTFPKLGIEPIQQVDPEQEVDFQQINPTNWNEEELKREISNFLVTIINLNAFIFLVSGAIALVITNRITASFLIIGQKMRDINLNKTNQEIEWKRKDEIGDPVAEADSLSRRERAIFAGRAVVEAAHGEHVEIRR